MAYEESAVGGAGEGGGPARQSAGGDAGLGADQAGDAGGLAQVVGIQVCQSPLDWALKVVRCGPTALVNDRCLGTATPRRYFNAGVQDLNACFK